MNRDLAINLIRVTEAAALGGAKFLGLGDKNMADQAAVDNMRKMFDTMSIDGTVVIGEGEMDEAPMLYIGEHIGKTDKNYPAVDIAVDPIDGTRPVAKGLNNGIAVVAMAPKGTLLAAPDMYMEKIVVGPDAAGCVDLNKPLRENLLKLADCLGKKVNELTITMLDRPRHEEAMNVCRELGVRVKLFNDGDVAASIEVCLSGDYTDIDILYGIGGAPEGVIAAGAVKCLGGQMQGRLMPKTDEEINRCKKMGADFESVLTHDKLVKGEEVYFAATGISDSNILHGVRFLSKNRVKTHSVVMRASTGTVRFVDAIHDLDKKPKYAR